MEKIESMSAGEVRARLRQNYRLLEHIYLTDALRLARREEILLLRDEVELKSRIAAFRRA